MKVEKEYMVRQERDTKERVRGNKKREEAGNLRGGNPVCPVLHNDGREGTWSDRRERKKGEKE
jgi:hypothetical protein